MPSCVKAFPGIELTPHFHATIAQINPTNTSQPHYARTITMSDQTPDIFISYSSKDREWVAKLAERLTTCGYNVWWDRELLPGENYHKAIESALNQSRCVVTVWSENSVESKWVLAESGRADKRGVLIPVIYKPATIPLAFDTSHNADLQHWQGDLDDADFQTLLRSITRITQKTVINAEAISATGFTPKPKQAIPKQLSRNYMAVAGLLLLVITVAIFWFISTPSNPTRDSSIHSEGDLTFEASGNGSVTVTTGDGQVGQMKK